MMTLSKTKDVKEFEYPSKVTLGGVLKGLWQTSKLDALFHSLMAILMVTGLAMDLLGFFWETHYSQSDKSFMVILESLSQSSIRFTSSKFSLHER
jgi:2C-methyl-D-erythritol 2,4-cyclodiphosphate synthase